MNRDPLPVLDAAPRTLVDAAAALPTYVKASVACHAGAAAVALAVPPAWPWALGVVVANHLALTGAGLWPRSGWLGRNWSRLPAAAAARGEIAVTLDDGPDPEVTPQVLDLLDGERLRATFFVIAERATLAPALCREIVRRGHSVQNHSAHHRHAFSFLGPQAMRREVGDAQSRIADITGIAPRFFRAPAGLRNPFLQPVLGRLGLELVSWTRRGFDTVRDDPQRVFGPLVRDLAAGDILLLHDGNAARAAGGRPVVLEVLPRLLARCREAGLRPVSLPAAFDASGGDPTRAAPPP